MAKIFKISGYFVAPRGNYTAGYVKDSIEINTLRADAFDRHVHVEEREIDNWSEELPINQKNCDLAECEKYFNNETIFAELEDDTRKVVAGQFYRHFKGKIVKVLCVSQSTESPGSYAVIYQCDGGTIWHRPLGMFLSEVDHVKYPNVSQKYRFELLRGENY